MIGQDFNILHWPDFCQLCPFFLLCPFIYGKMGALPMTEGCIKPIFFSILSVAYNLFLLLNHHTRNGYLTHLNHLPFHECQFKNSAKKNIKKSLSKISILFYQILVCQFFYTKHIIVMRKFLGSTAAGA
jgi:hypothetical protein